MHDETSVFNEGDGAALTLAPGAIPEGKVAAGGSAYPGGRQPTVILHAHHRSDSLADALGRGLDFPVPEMGVAQCHAHIAVAEQPRDDRHRYPVHHRVARQRMAQVVKADILDPCFLADPIP